MNENIRQKLADLPQCAGSYQMLDKGGNIIYVGKAVNLKNRVSSYFVNTRSHNEKTKALVKNIADFTYIVTPTELDALCLEANLIKQHQPYYNILLKDGKQFAYIKINTKAPYPKIEVVRKVKNDGYKYFGPYFNGVYYKEIIELISYAFNLRTCNFNFSETKPLKRACLNFDMGLCCAPCVNKVSQQEYSNKVKLAIDFLNGNTATVKQILTQKMQHFASLQNFETALIYRNLLATVNKLDNKVHTQLTSTLECDVIGFCTNGIYSCISVATVKSGKILGVENFIINSVSENAGEIISEFLTQYYTQNKIIPKQIFVPYLIKDADVLKQYFTTLKGNVVNIVHVQKGEKKKLIEIANQNAEEFLQKNIEKEKQQELLTLGACKQLQEYLNLKEMPLRIEGYDISNISGTNKVASMVVFINGKPAKQHYRKFKIDDIEGQNDFACMNEVLERRANELKKATDLSFSQKPNLILIDGGKGQLSSALASIQPNIDCDVISLAKRLEEVYKPNNPIPVILNHSTYALRLLQRVRDESHRFAITFHRQRRNKQTLKNTLSEISGIGKTKQQHLFNHFKSFEKIKNASIYELMQASRISKTDAINIYNFYHKEK